MSFSGRLLAFLAVSFLGTAGVACADLSKLLEPLPGATLGRPSGLTASVPKQALPQTTPLVRTNSSQILTEAELVSAIEKDLPKRYAIQGDLRVSLARPWAPLQLPDQDFFADCIQLPPGLVSNMSVTVRGVSGGKIIGEWPLQLRVQVYQQVWVAPQRLERGQVIERGMLAVQQVDLLRELFPPVPADQDLSGFELAQSVQLGKSISRRDLVERSLVKKGQFVDAVAGEGGLSIRMRAMALEGGPAGAVIRVRNLDSRKEFYAQVINENQVQVRF